jgi:hypothetical protein
MKAASQQHGELVEMTMAREIAGSGMGQQGSDRVGPIVREISKNRVHLCTMSH